VTEIAVEAPHAVPDPRRWRALAVICVAFFMTVLDVSIVNVALPSIQSHLHFSDTGIQWVVTAYAITFGGFLLLGGRMGDVLGRRRMFMVGLVLFSVASLTCGLAGSPGVLVASRAVQGLGAALISPATLALITTTFEEGAERNKALGIWGAMGGGGAAAGVLFGGILTKYLGWEWIFFVNVPVGALVLALTPGLVRESRAHAETKSFDLPGAAMVTAGNALLVFGISKAPKDGWGSTQTVVSLVAAAALLVSFVLWEMRTTAPLMPLRIFRVATVAGANAVSLLLGAVVFSNFLLLTFYVQNVLGYSALEAGVSFLSTAGTVVLWAGLAQYLTTHYGPRLVMTVGFLALAGGMLWYTQIPPDGHYWPDLLPGYLLVGFGLAFAFIPVSIAALAGVGHREAGLASGMVNTGQQLGGAIGVAVALTIATSRANALSKTGSDPATALTSGFARAFWAMAGVALAGAVLSLILVRVRSDQLSEAEVEPAG
jgi:EmrB/QacA subfamily drug resistance transporter